MIPNQVSLRPGDIEERIPSQGWLLKRVALSSYRIDYSGFLRVEETLPNY
jgi:hypothetical protein